MNNKESEKKERKKTKERRRGRKEREREEKAEKKDGQWNWSTGPNRDFYARILLDRRRELKNRKKWPMFVVTSF